MPLQLSAVCEAVAALGAVEALLGLLVPVLDVLLQGAVTLVATCAVRAGEQLRERVWGSCVKKKHTREKSFVRTCVRVKGWVGRWGVERRGLKHMVNREGSLMFHKAEQQ